MTYLTKVLRYTPLNCLNLYFDVHTWEFMLFTNIQNAIAVVFNET